MQGFWCSSRPSAAELDTGTVGHPRPGHGRWWGLKPVRWQFNQRGSPPGPTRTSESGSQCTYWRSDDSQKLKQWWKYLQTEKRLYFVFCGCKCQRSFCYGEESLFDLLNSDRLWKHFCPFAIFVFLSVLFLCLTPPRRLSRRSYSWALNRLSPSDPITQQALLPAESRWQLAAPFSPLLCPVFIPPSSSSAHSVTHSVSSGLQGCWFSQPSRFGAAATPIRFGSWSYLF